MKQLLILRVKLNLEALQMVLDEIVEADETEERMEEVNELLDEINKNKARLNELERGA